MRLPIIQYHHHHRLSHICLYSMEMKTMILLYCMLRYDLFVSRGYGHWRLSWIFLFRLWVVLCGGLEDHHLRGCHCWNLPAGSRGIVWGWVQSWVRLPIMLGYCSFLKSLADSFSYIIINDNSIHQPINRIKENSSQIYQPTN